jgi:hypothetical protein
VVPLTQQQRSLAVAYDGQDEHFARHVVAEPDVELWEEQVVLDTLLLQVDSATESTGE